LPTTAISVDAPLFTVHDSETTALVGKYAWRGGRPGW